MNTHLADENTFLQDSPLITLDTALFSSFDKGVSIKLKAILVYAYAFVVSPHHHLKVSPLLCAIKIGESNKLGRHGTRFIVSLTAISEPFTKQQNKKGKKPRRHEIKIIKHNLQW